jgi:tape measure domain-containing protein
MASKTVQPIAIKLGIEGGEKLAALNRSFRDLSKQVKLSDSDINQATKDIVKFATEAGNSEATIKGQIKAFEGLREQAALGGKAYIQLGKDIESLKVALRGSTDEMEQQRAAFVKTGNVAKSSASDIAGVISQLENLRNKARPGSSAFAQLGKDIAALKSQLQEANVEVKKFNAGFEISQRPAMSLEKIQRQIGRLAEGLKGLNFISDEFLNTQERIALLGQVQGRTTARQQVRAQAQMYSSAAFANFVEGPAGKLSLPNTTAALQLEVTELQQKLVNLDRSSSDYTATAMLLADAQRKLAQDVMGLSSAYDKLEAAEAGVARRAGKVAGIQQYYAGGAGAPGVAGYRDPATGAIIARGAGNVADRRAFLAAQREDGLSQYSAPISPELPETIRKANEERKQEIRSRIENLRRINKENEALREQAAINRSIARGRAKSIAQVAAEPPVREISGLYRQIGDIGMSKITASIEMMGQSYSTVATDIKKATAASNGSIASLNNQRSAWSSLRDQLNPASKQFRDVTKELEKVDRALSKAQRRRGLSSMQMTQAAGAAISGGIFGGPEGFLGGVAGGLLGGVGGAFAGAAIGAQVGVFRQQLGQVADYVAQLNLAKTTLAGVSANQDEYNRSLDFARQLSRDYSVRIGDVIKGYASVNAAAKANNLSLEETEALYRGIITSGVAFGKSQEDIQALIVATTQVLSKGKVSAEELQGQIGERLPGAVARFAQETNRSLPQLAEDFKKGEVTIADFVTFARGQGEEFDAIARKIAEGPEKAQIRLQIALDLAGENFGGFFQKVGAGFQDYAKGLVDFLNNNEKTIKRVLVVAGIGFGALGKLISSFAKWFVGVFNSAFTRILGSLDTVLSRVENAINRAKAVESLTPETLAAARTQARLETEKKFGVLGLPLILDQEAASKFYNQRFNELIDAATKAAGATNFTDRVRDIMFPEFTPTEFGAGGDVPQLGGDQTSGGGTADKDAERQANKIAAAEAKAIELGEKLRRKLRDVAFEFKGVGASAEEAIYLKASEAINAAIDQEGDLLKQIDELSKVTGNPYENLRKSATEYAGALVVVAEKQRDLALEELSNKRFSEMLKGYGFSGDVDVSGKVFGSMTPQEFPTGVDSILQPNQLRQNIEEFRASLQQLVEPVNQITNAATAIGDAFSQSFVDAISGSKTAKEALADFFQSVGSYFLDMAKQIIAKMIQIAILNSVAKLLPGLGSTGSGAFDLGGMGKAFAPGGSMPFPMLANGGPVNANEPYIVGERGPELFIPFQRGQVVSNEDSEDIMEAAFQRSGGSSNVSNSYGGGSSNVSNSFQQMQMVNLPFTRTAEQASVIAAEREAAQALRDPGPIDVRYESTVINNTEYVTAEQHRRGMAQAAERGRALTLQALQNSPKTRTKVGI